MKTITPDGKITPITLPEKKGTQKVDFEFQQLGIELEPIYGKVIWSAFHKYHIDKIKDAVKIARQRSKETYPYLVGIIKKLK